MSERGVLWDIETRHLSNYFETTLGGAYIEDDRGGYNRRLDNEIAEGLITPEEAYPFRGKDRWAYGLEQDGGGGDQRWTTRIDYSEMSDRDYLRDLDSSALDVNREAQLRKMASAGYRGNNWQYGIGGEELRALSSTQQPYRELPRIHAHGGYRLGDWQIDLLNEYTRFDINHYFEDDTDNVIVGERLRTDYRLTWDKDWIWGFIKPGVAVKALQYDLDDGALIEDANTRPSLAVPQGSLDMGLYFERDEQLFGYGYTQTLEPRLFYFYSDYEDHSELLGLTTNNRNVDFDTTELTFGYSQLFRTTRFAGGDRIDDANQLSIGITSRFIDSSTGVERLSMSIGQIFHFADRRVTRSGVPVEDDYSGIAGQLQVQVSDHVRVSTDLVYDPGEKRLDSGNLRLNYMNDDYRIFNIAYRYTRNPPSPDRFNPDLYRNRSLDQVDVTMLWPLYGQWSMVARYNHDFTYGRELYTFAGLEYDDCCYRIRVLARRWLDFDYTPNLLEQVTRDDYDRGIVFDIQFKGLGSINDKISSLLDRAIIGYGAREDALH
jgi:LPS-assembly protein